MQYVWVLARDCDGEIIGIYATAEAAFPYAQPKRGDDETVEITQCKDGDFYINAGGYMHFLERYEVKS